jgi:hypothetical protein
MKNTLPFDLIDNRKKFIKTTLLLATYLLIFVVLYLIYSRLFATVGGNSDGAGDLLEAKSILSGNWLLKGWTLTADTFWTIDTPINTIAMSIRGFVPSLLYTVPAFIYALIMMAGLFLIKRKSNLAESWPMIVLGLTIMGILSPLLTKFAAESPMHFGTILYCLIVLVLYENVNNSWQRNIAIFIIATLAYIGDPFTLFILILPALTILGFRWYYGERKRNDLILIGALIATIPAAVFIGALIKVFGGFHQKPLNAAFTSYSDLSNNISLSIQSVLSLFGINAFSQAVISKYALESMLRFFAFCLAVYFAVKSIKRIINKEINFDIISGILCIAIIFDIGSFILSTQAVDLGSARFLTPVVIFGAIIVGRNINIKQRWLSLATILLLVTYLFFFVPRLLAPPATSIAADAENWLQTNGYTSGYGSYWYASLITVDTSANITVRPVLAQSNGYVAPYNHLSDSAWYANMPANFLIYDDNDSGAALNVDAAAKTFGMPSQIKQIGELTILIWDHNIASQLR